MSILSYKGNLLPTHKTYLQNKVPSLLNELNGYYKILIKSKPKTIKN